MTPRSSCRASACRCRARPAPRCMGRDGVLKVGTSRRGRRGSCVLRNSAAAHRSNGQRRATRPSDGRSGRVQDGLRTLAPNAFELWLRGIDRSGGCSSQTEMRRLTSGALIKMRVCGCPGASETHSTRPRRSAATLTAWSSSPLRRRSIVAQSAIELLCISALSISSSPWFRVVPTPRLTSSASAWIFHRRPAINSRRRFEATRSPTGGRRSLRHSTGRPSRPTRERSCADGLSQS